MTAKELAGAVAGVAALALTAVIVIGEGDEKPEVKGTERRVGLTKLAITRDGGKAYVVEVEVDGGVEKRIVSTPGCVRRPKGVDKSECQRRTVAAVAPFEPVTIDPGELNRFDESEAVGTGCQPVACSVTAGEDADAEEDERLEAVRDAGVRR